MTVLILSIFSNFSYFWINFNAVLGPIPLKPLILKSLNALEDRLDEKTFFRANRKHIVNLRMIDKVEPYFNGGLLLDLKGGEKIEVSRRQTVKFKEMMSL